MKYATFRNAPLLKVKYVCIDRETAINFLYLYQDTHKGTYFDISGNLYLVNKLGFNFCNRYLFLDEIEVYGFAPINKEVFHLEIHDEYHRFHPYGYLNRGWFSSIEDVYRTKEWKTVASAIHKEGIHSTVKIDEICIRISPLNDWFKIKASRYNIIK